MERVGLSSLSHIMCINVEQQAADDKGGCRYKRKEEKKKGEPGIESVISWLTQVEADELVPPSLPVVSIAMMKRESF